MLPAAQVLHPDQPVPPHCPYFAVEQPEGPVEADEEVVVGFADEEVVVVGFADEEVVMVVVVGFVDEEVVVVVLEVETGVVVVVVGEVPVELHPTRVEETAISSYQNVLASPPYDSQPK